MTNKDELHEKLDALIPANSVSRSNLRIIGHALIELNLMTSVECGWEHCRQTTREFEPYLPEGCGKQRNPRVASVDHVVSRSDGGSDLPWNIQLLHFGCNAAKGAIDARKNPDIQKKVSEALSKRWDNPEYREKMIAAATAANQTPETRARKSQKMRDRWNDPVYQEKMAQTRSRKSIAQTCEDCGKVCRSKQGLTLHRRNQH